MDTDPEDDAGDGPLSQRTPHDNVTDGDLGEKIIVSQGPSTSDLTQFGTLDHYLKSLGYGLVFEGPNGFEDPRAPHNPTIIGPGPNANTTEVVRYTKFELPASVGNVVQGDTLTYDVTFQAEQWRNNLDITPFHNTGSPQSIDLSTGTGVWTVADSPDGTSGPAQTGGAHPAWVSDQCGDWIDPYGNNPETSDPEGQYTFKTTFTVAQTNAGATLEFRWAADNEAVIELDGTEIASTSSSSFDSLYGPESTQVNPGQHRLTVTVKNYTGNGNNNNPAGLLFCGDVTY